MRLARKVFWLGTGLAAGAYLVRRGRRNRTVRPPVLTDHRGVELEPRTLRLDGGEEVEVVTAGRGPALILIPGLSGDKEVFRYQVPAFSERYRVITADLRYGFEGVPEDFDQFAHDVARLLDELDQDSAAVLGLSFGGAIAMRFAALYPERTDPLILNNTLSRLDLGHVGLNRTLLIPLALLSTRYLPDRLARRMADVWGDLGVWVFDASPGNGRIIDYYLQSAVRAPVSDGTRRMDMFRDRDLRAELPGIEVPTLVLRGATDRYCLPEWQEEIARLLPDAEYKEIPGAGHLALISHSETFNRVVLDWLDRQLAGREAGTTAAERPAQGAAADGVGTDGAAPDGVGADGSAGDGSAADGPSSG